MLFTLYTVFGLMFGVSLIAYLFLARTHLKALDTAPWETLAKSGKS